MKIGLAQPTISQHLKELKSIDLIRGEVEGKEGCYCIKSYRNGQKYRPSLISFFNTLKQLLLIKIQNMKTNDSCLIKAKT